MKPSPKSIQRIKFTYDQNKNLWALPQPKPVAQLNGTTIRIEEFNK